MCQVLRHGPDLRPLPSPDHSPGHQDPLRQPSTTMDNTSEASNYSSPDNNNPPAQYSQNARKPPRADRPCDTCRKRKSRCVKDPGQEKCVLCTFHHRECTYLDEPQRRKKRKAEGQSHLSSISEQAGVSTEAYVPHKPRPLESATVANISLNAAFRENQGQIAHANTSSTTAPIEADRF